MQHGDRLRSGDEVGAWLTALANGLRLELVDVATIERTEFLGADMVGWDLQPTNPRATPVSWMLYGDELLVQVGKLHRGGRWELDRSMDDAYFVERVARAAIAGRVTEISAPARSRVDVTFEDGQLVHETGYEGCQSLFIPLPGWRHWGRGIHYEPYARIH